eukprot:586366-Amphidinium_carterae.1
MTSKANSGVSTGDTVDVDVVMGVDAASMPWSMQSLWWKMWSVASMWSMTSMKKVDGDVVVGVVDVVEVVGGNLNCSMSMSKSGWVEVLEVRLLVLE